VLIRSVLSGTTPVVMDVVSRGFDVDSLPGAVAALGRGRRYASLVATQLAKALQHPPACAALAELDALLIGGGPLPASVAGSASAAGIPVVRTYGMSETAGGCVYDGVPLDGVAVRVEAGAATAATSKPRAATAATSKPRAATAATSAARAATAATSNSGRVVLGGATLAKGYRNPPSPDPFAEPGWFRTDDAGHVDERGVLTVYGRLDEAISTGGLTVLPQLVESALATHPAVAQCAVFAVRDDRLGERVTAAVVLTPGAEAPTLDELRAHAAQSLDSTAAPRELHVVDELPVRGIGKVDRRALAERFAGG
jgi:O-succinylbenzoic acid--CoA ligase